MKLIEYFRVFLRDSVNLNRTRLAYLDERVDSITDAIKSATELDGMVLDTVPQGSWAHRTIIRPPTDIEFDADFLVQLSEQSDWAGNPTKYADAVWDAVRNHSTYGSMTSRKNRCVRVTYANDCHIDIIPYVVEWSGREVIVNRTTGEFEETNPVGFTEWIQERDDYTGGDLRKVLRLLKYLRDHCGTFQIKSVLLTVLVGNVVSQWSADGDYYKDVPTTLVNVVEDLDTWLQLHPTKPHVADPSCPATDFDHRWTENQYQAFRSKVHTLAPALRAAYDLADRDESIAEWRNIFGPSFPDSVANRATAASASPLSVSDRAPGEQFIEELFEVDLQYSVTMKGELQERSYPNRDARRRFLRSKAGRITRGRSIRFRILSTDVSEPYDIYWKVRNHGDEARRRGQLRGSIFRDGPERSEHTAYAGHHYVDCYLVKDGVCVATARERVDIPDLPGG
jgi:hypothetical protein